jgi:hypothetical protein
MGTYALIIWLILPFTAIPESRGSITVVQEITGKQLCEAALEKIKAQSKDKIIGVCVPTKLYTSITIPNGPTIELREK